MIESRVTYEPEEHGTLVSVEPSYHADGKQFTTYGAARLYLIEKYAAGVLAVLNADKEGGYFICEEASGSVKSLEEAMRL
jgi:hypothetical protein